MASVRMVPRARLAARVACRALCPAPPCHLLRTRPCLHNRVPRRLLATTTTTAASPSPHASPREIAEQLQRAEDQKAAAFGRNDFAALPALQEEVERLAALLQAAEGAGRAAAAARSKLERSQAERLAELRRDAEQAVSGAQAAVRDKL
jgi:hypothetical protein